VASDGADAACQPICSRAEIRLVIDLKTALGREILMLLAKVIATFAARLLRCKCGMNASMTKAR
jgi:hypothetical protein